MKIKTHKKQIIKGVVIAVSIALLVTALWQGLAIRSYAEITGKVRSPIKIAVLTDLHDSIYGSSQKNLIKAIRKQNPDLILFVGDIADDEGEHEGTKQLLSVVGAEYPCYYVSGNHEYWSYDIDSIKKMIRSFGVTILEGETVIVNVRNQEIRLCGVDDPDGSELRYLPDPNLKINWQEQYDMCKAKTGDNIYSILLSHRPELTDYYRDSGFDLVVSGHSHGGQVRIPGILNGLFAPDQGFFPQYAGGKYDLGETVVIVSRGLSKKILPRIFNAPEFVMISIEPEE